MSSDPTACGQVFSPSPPDAKSVFAPATVEDPSDASKAPKNPLTTAAAKPVTGGACAWSTRVKARVVEGLLRKLDNIVKSHPNKPVVCDRRYGVTLPDAEFVAWATAIPSVYDVVRALGVQYTVQDTPDANADPATTCSPLALVEDVVRSLFGPHQLPPLVRSWIAGLPSFATIGHARAHFAFAPPGFVAYFLDAVTCNQDPNGKTPTAQFRNKLRSDLLTSLTEELAELCRHDGARRPATARRVAALLWRDDNASLLVELWDAIRGADNIGRLWLDDDLGLTFGPHPPSLLPNEHAFLIRREALREALHAADRVRPVSMPDLGDFVGAAQAAWGGAFVIRDLIARWDTLSPRQALAHPAMMTTSALLKSFVHTIAEQHLQSQHEGTKRVRAALANVQKALQDKSVTNPPLWLIRQYAKELTGYSEKLFASSQGDIDDLRAMGAAGNADVDAGHVLFGPHAIQVLLSRGAGSIDASELNGFIAMQLALGDMQSTKTAVTMKRVRNKKVVHGGEGGTPMPPVELLRWLWTDDHAQQHIIAAWDAVQRYAEVHASHDAVSVSSRRNFLSA